MKWPELIEMARERGQQPVCACAYSRSAWRGSRSRRRDRPTSAPALAPPIGCLLSGRLRRRCRCVASLCNGFRQRHASMNGIMQAHAAAHRLFCRIHSQQADAQLMIHVSDPACLRRLLVVELPGHLQHMSAGFMLMWTAVRAAIPAVRDGPYGSDVCGRVSHGGRVAPAPGILDPSRPHDSLAGKPIAHSTVALERLQARAQLLLTLYFHSASRCRWSTTGEARLLSTRAQRMAPSAAYACRFL